MRYFPAVFFLVMSFLNVSMARTAQPAQVTHNQAVLQTTPTPVPTSTSEASPTRTGPPLSLTLILLGMCCAFSLVIGVVVLGFVARNPKNKEANNSNL